MPKRRLSFSEAEAAGKMQHDTVFCADPDLLVEVTDHHHRPPRTESFSVHSQLLMLGSPVWQRMLTCGMSEGVTKTVKLDEDIEEFRLFYSLLHIATAPSLTRQAAFSMSRWADYYECEALKSRCEEYLIMFVECHTQEALAHAIDCNLHRRVRQCMSAIKKELPNTINCLAPLAAPGNEQLMEEVWPAICASLGDAWASWRARFIADNMEDVRMQTTPPLEQIRQMWPFIAAAVMASPKWAAEKSYYFTRPDSWPA